MNKLSTTLFLLAVPAVAVAQETPDTVELREVVVTATRLPSQPTAVAAAVSVLDGDDLRARGIRTVEQALRTVTGTALVQGGSHGAFASLFMRGGESDYVQVLVDGVQINSPGEHFDFGNLTLENIERIEIMRGPGSVLYGSDAVTGVIQLFTHRGSRRNAVAVAAFGGVGSRVGALADGSFASGGAHASLQGRSRGVDFSAGVSHFRSAGAYAFNNEHANTGLTARIAVTPDRRTDAAATVRLGTNTFHYPTDGAGLLVDTNQYHTADAAALGLDVGRRIATRLEARVLLGFSRNDDSYYDAPDHAGDTLGFYAFRSAERFERVSADVRLNYAITARTTLSLGGETERQRERGSSVTESEFGPFAGASNDARVNRALYAQLAGESRRGGVQAGVRLEDNELFGRHATYRGGISARLTPLVRARVSAGTGFKEPRFYEQFATGFVRGNPALQPEESRSLEAGVDVVSGASRITATFFAQRFRNLIQYVAAPPQDAPNYTNLAAARANGLELEADYVLAGLSLRGVVTLLDTEVTDPGTGDDPLFLAGRALIRRPRASGAVTAAYATHGWRFGAALHYVGERADLDFTQYPPRRVDLAAYNRLDLTVDAPLHAAGWRALARIENALNEGYEEVRNFPARGRIVELGLRYGR